MSTSSVGIPTDLQAAMRARDEAFYAVDPEQWSKYTASAFTTVQQNGVFYSRDNRLMNLQAQAKRPYVARTREQFEHSGNLVVTRFFSGGLSVVEVWTREADSWVVAMSQATTAQP